MGKKSKKKVLTFEEFASRVMRLVRHLKIVIDELERQRQKINQLEKTIENLKMEIDTLKAKLAGRPAEHKTAPILPKATQPKLLPSVTETNKTPVDELLPEFPEVPSPEEVSAPPIEEVLPEVPEIPETSEIPELPTPEIKEIEPKTESPLQRNKGGATVSPPSATPTPEAHPATSATPKPPPEPEDYSDLDRYLDKLDQIVEQIGIPEIKEEPPKEEVVPEVSPESEDAGTTVSTEELKKKKKDILKALTELESA